jgi:hypothetical protein
MPGVRIQHPNHRDTRVTVVEGGNPYTQPYTCTPPDLGGCGSVHLFKTHHINLDAAGSAIVSETVYERTRVALEGFGFTTTGEVAKPPTIVIGMKPGGPGAWGDIPILRANEEPI